MWTPVTSYFLDSAVTAASFWTARSSVSRSKVNDYRFKGKRIVPIVGIPEHTIVLGEFTTGMESNLWMGVDYANDAEVVKVERLQANSELYFFQMRMKMDVNIVRPAEIVAWTAYKNTVVSGG